MYVSPTSIPLLTSSLHKHNHQLSYGVQLFRLDVTKPTKKRKLSIQYSIKKKGIVKVKTGIKMKREKKSGFVITCTFLK